MPERHTGQHIADRLTKAAADWSISTAQISACVRDNAANTVRGLELTGWSISVVLATHFSRDGR